MWFLNQSKTKYRGRRLEVDADGTARLRLVRFDPGVAADLVTPEELDALEEQYPDMPITVDMRNDVLGVRASWVRSGAYTPCDEHGKPLPEPEPEEKPDQWKELHDNHAAWVESQRLAGSWKCSLCGETAAGPGRYEEDGQLRRYCREHLAEKVKAEQPAIGPLPRDMSGGVCRYYRVTDKVITKTSVVPGRCNLEFCNGPARTVTRTVSLEVCDPDWVTPHDPEGVHLRPLVPGEVVKPTRAMLDNGTVQRYLASGFLVTSPPPDADAPMSVQTCRVRFRPAWRNHKLTIYTLDRESGEVALRAVKEGDLADVVAPTLGSQQYRIMVGQGVLEPLDADGDPMPVEHVPVVKVAWPAQPGLIGMMVAGKVEVLALPPSRLLVVGPEDEKSRITIPLGRLDDDDEGPEVRVKVHGSVLPSLELRYGVLADDGRVVWSAPAPGPEKLPPPRVARREIDEAEAKEELPPAVLAAIEFLRRELAAGPVPVADLEARGKAESPPVSKRTLERAKSALGVVHQRMGGRFAGYEWSLPEGGA